MSGLQNQWKGTEEEVTHTALYLGHQDTACGGFPWDKVEAVVLSMCGGRTVGWMANVAMAAQPMKADSKGGDSLSLPITFSLIGGCGNIITCSAMKRHLILGQFTKN